MSHERPHGWSLYPKATGLSAFQFRMNGEQKGQHESTQAIGRGARGRAILLQGGVPACESVESIQTMSQHCGSAALPPSIQSRFTSTVKQLGYGPFRACLFGLDA